jgi:hypothetical protein
MHVDEGPSSPGSLGGLESGLSSRPWQGPLLFIEFNPWSALIMAERQGGAFLAEVERLVAHLKLCGRAIGSKSAQSMDWRK